MQSRVNLDNALERRNNHCFQILPQNIFPNNEFVTFKLDSRHVDSISRRLVNLILIYQRPSQRHVLFQRNIFPCCNIVGHNMYAAKVCYPVATFNILQHISRKWPNVRNMLYETMLFSRYIQLLLAFGRALRKSSAILTLFPDVLFKIASSHIGFISAHFVRRILIIKNNSRKFGLVFQMFYWSGSILRKKTLGIFIYTPGSFWRLPGRFSHMYVNGCIYLGRGIMCLRRIIRLGRYEK